MKFVSNLFRALARRGAGRSCARHPQTFRPQLEALEGRLVPASVLTSHGAGVLENVQVENVYYGQAWASNATNIQQLDTFMKTIVGSTYMSMLGEYGVGQGSFYGHDLVDSSAAPKSGTVTESQIQQMLLQEIEHGHVPQESGSQLYVVYLPSNLISQQDGNAAVGHHGDFVAPVGPGGLNQTVYYAVITNPADQEKTDWAANAGLNNFQGQTEVSTHELSEAVTDPTVGGGWWDSNSSSPYYKDEIGDIVNFQYTSFDGYTVQQEWSNYFNKGIAPGAPIPSTARVTAHGQTLQSDGETLFWETLSNGSEYYQWATPTTNAAGPGQDFGWFTL